MDTQRRAQEIGWPAGGAAKKSSSSAVVAMGGSLG